MWGDVGECKEDVRGLFPRTNPLLHPLTEGFTRTSGVLLAGCQGAAALDLEVVAHEALHVRRRALQWLVIDVVLGVHVELDAGPRPEGNRRDRWEGEEGDDRDGGQRLVRVVRLRARVRVGVGVGLGLG